MQIILPIILFFNAKKYQLELPSIQSVLENIYFAQGQIKVYPNSGKEQLEQFSVTNQMLRLTYM